MRVLPWNQAGQVPLASSKKKKKSHSRSSAFLLCACCKPIRRQRPEEVKSFQPTPVNNKGKLEAEATSALLHCQQSQINNKGDGNANSNSSSSTVPGPILPPTSAPAAGNFEGSSSEESKTRIEGRAPSCNVPLKSSLKKPPVAELSCSSQASNVAQLSNGINSNDGGGPVGSFTAGKKRVQWIDAHGMELVHIQEFEPSDSGGSDDEEDEISQGCSCIIQ
eukprot:TRINITY_DN7311_c0_g4_i1.p1 TRINITY_DN7311_c0_g4~~TRINITY_DN7311_c0_g4_i1.p1  ORF type:complete len:221 (+),score=46.66 TRINITY_DN7311_c0_g4_i1:124-786(+)